MIARKIITFVISAILIMARMAGAETGQDNLESTGTARISAGLSIDYAWWNPVWGRINQTGDMFVYYLFNINAPFFKIERRSRTYAVDPALNYGVHIVADLPKRWGVSAEAAASTYRDSSVMVASLTTNPFSPSDYLKYRIDTINVAASFHAHYRITDWLKLGLGPVYQGCILKESNTGYFLSQSQKESIHMIGLSAGGSFDIRLADNLYLRPSASFLYLYGFVSGNPGLSQRKNANTIGVASAVSLAYYIEKIRVTLGLGFRYQGLYYFQVTNSDYLNKWDHRYGVTESITYTF